MDEAEPDVLAYMAFPTQRRTKLHSTNPLKRLLNGEIRQRSEVSGFFQRGRRDMADWGFPLGAEDERSAQRARYMTLKNIAPLSDDAIVRMPALIG